MGSRKWLESALDTDWLPMIRHLNNTKRGRQKADQMCQDLRRWWSSRGLTTLRQQQSLMDITRKKIKQQLGEDHWVLDHIKFSTQEYIDLNIDKQQSVAQRNEHIQFIDNPDAIVNQAVRLLESPEWADICAGLAVLTGRRSSELLSTANFTPRTRWSVTFTGALKRGGELQELAFEIPTLTTAQRVLEALDRVRHELPEATRLAATTVNQKYGRAVEAACDRAFQDLVPNRQGKDSLYTHLFRAVYATIATFWYCPPNVHAEEFKAAIQGHFAILDEKNPELRRSLAAGRHYSDYEIADAVIAQHDGKRKGIKLGHGGIEPIAMFRESWQQYHALSFPAPPKAEAGSAERQEPLDVETTTPQASRRLKSLRIYASDRQQLESIFEALEFEGTQAEQISQLVRWVQDQMARTAAPAPEPEPEAPSASDAEAEVESDAPSEPESGASGLEVETPSEPEPTTETNLPGQSTSSLEHRISDLIDVMSQFVQVQLNANSSSSTPPPRPSPAPQHQPASTTSSRTSRGQTETVIHQAIDAIMAYNDAAERHDDKWYISINALKSYSGSQRKIEQILEDRAEEIEAHHQTHQIDMKQNYKHRGENIAEWVPLD